MSTRTRRVAALAAASLVAGSGLVGLAALPAYAATIPVTTTSGGTGAGTLYAAIVAANASPDADVIDLSGLSGTITLAQSLPYIVAPVTITGPGSGSLTIDANFHRALHADNNPVVVAGMDFTVTGLTVNYSDGDGIRGDNVNMTLDDVSSNDHDDDALQVSNTGDYTLSITNSSFTEAGDTAGEISLDGGSSSISNTLFQVNAGNESLVIDLDLTAQLSLADVEAYNALDNATEISLSGTSFLTSTDFLVHGTNGRGIDMDAFDTASADFTDTTVYQSCGDGIHVDAWAFATVDFEGIDQDRADNCGDNGYWGVFLGASDSALISASDVATDDQSNGFATEASDGGHVVVTNWTAAGIIDRGFSAASYPDVTSAGGTITLTGGSVATTEDDTDYGYSIEAGAADITLTDTAEDGFDVGYSIEASEESGVLLDEALASGAAEYGAYVLAETDSTVTIVDSTFDSNDTGIQVDRLESGASFTLDSSTVSNSEYGGVIIYPGSDGTATIVNSTITGTDADGSRGYDSYPLWVDGDDDGDSFFLLNSTVSGNVGEEALGIAEIGTALISHSIVSGNDTDVWGDLTILVSTDVDVEWSIIGVATDFALTSEIEEAGAGLEVAADSIEAATLVEGDGVIYSDDPELGALADNGGPTLTMMPLDGSIAVDAGNADVTGEPEFDQRGEDRVLGSAIDIGAVESEATLAATGAQAETGLGIAAALLLLGATLIVARIVRHRHS